MDEASRQVIEQMKRDAAMFDEMNAVVPVRGTREKIGLEGRIIDTVFYPATEKNAPIVFAFHGGGFMLGGCALDDGLWHTLQRTLGANLVSIGYRKGEENPFPAPLYDAYDVIRYYLADEVHEFDRGKIAVMGNSAGATESATVSILANRRREYSIGLQILVYPVVDTATPPEAKRLDPMEQALYQYFNEAHAKKEDWRDPLVSPLYASDKDLMGLPRAILVLAERDGLVDEGKKYAERLREAGVQADCMVSEGMLHGFLEFAHREELGDFCPPAIVAAAADGTLAKQAERAVEFIRLHFQDWARQ